MDGKITSIQVAIIGGGPAGIEAASILSRYGVQVSLFEGESKWAHNVGNKFKLFPDFSSADELVQTLSQKIVENQIPAYLSTKIVALEKQKNAWVLTDEQGRSYVADTVLLATGYDIFDAKRKEELGYGIYNGVMTSVDLEAMLKTGKITNVLGEQPQCVTFLQCVGSRDEKIGNHYCSKVCCVTAVKQAIEVKKMSPQTLVGQPLKMSTDLLVLMVGMEASCGTKKLAACCGIDGEYGFALSKQPHLADNQTAQRGLFVAGACKRPMSISDAINDARAAATEIVEYLKIVPANKK